MDFHKPSTIRITCARGLAPYLEQDVARLGLHVNAADDTGVEVEGSLHDCMGYNLHLRIGQYVLYLLDRFSASTADEVYGHVVALPWEEMISPDEYVSVMCTVETQTINDSRFASRRVKDAIVDRISSRLDRRPNSGPDRDNVVIHLHWQASDCQLYINTTGRKLADRNYRKIPLKAPMQEILAAAVIMETGYDGSQPLVNPMCGSGTLAIEAALIATGRPPGLLRSNFAFAHLLGFDAQAWQAIRAEARKFRNPQPPAPIIASDIDDRAVEAARQNAKTAGVDQLIRFEVCDFAATSMPADPGIVILNPEYGERMGEAPALEAVYDRIGDFFKQKCPGCTGYVFSGNPNLAKMIGDNMISQRFHKGFFAPSAKHLYARVDSIEALALLNLAAAIRGEPDVVPDMWPGQGYFSGRFDGIGPGRTTDNAAIYSRLRS